MTEEELDAIEANAVHYWASDEPGAAVSAMLCLVAEVRRLRAEAARLNEGKTDVC